MNLDNSWHLKKGNSPIVATAIHHGHELREEVAALMKLDEQVRLREEDPFTGEWTLVSETAVVVDASRFQVDLNRTRDTAVYREPRDAWGLDVWKEPLSAECIERSLSEYDNFYKGMYTLFKQLEQQFGRFVVFDFHSYNHRREGMNAPPADPTENPEVNIGTGSVNGTFWIPLIDRFINDLSSCDFLGRRLDVRENVKFFGGNFAHWTHENFPNSACVLAVEFKKFFMDEWTGKPANQKLTAITGALQSTVPGVLEELSKK